MLRYLRNIENHLYIQVRLVSKREDATNIGMMNRLQRWLFKKLIECLMGSNFIESRVVSLSSREETDK